MARAAMRDDQYKYGFEASTDLALELKDVRGDHWFYLNRREPI
jgi:hypothetical protein